MYGNVKPNTQLGQVYLPLIPATSLALGSPLNAAARPPHEASLSLPSDKGCILLVDDGCPSAYKDDGPRPRFEA